ncbi:MAG: insulinase family protein [candidate division Zixibacteria bacterium]|nr:insulinase family protein [candidate division Zixibacteria bacterium]
MDRQKVESSSGVFEKTTLPNGIRVLSERFPAVRSISLGLWIDVGSRNEPDKLAGVCHFVEHMVFKGTKHRSARELASALESIGGSLNAFTTREQTCYTARVTDEYLTEAIDVLADMSCHATFKQADMTKEKQVISEEIKESIDNPSDLIHDLFQKTYWGSHPLGRPIMGSQKSIASLKHPDMLSFIRDNYRTGGVVVAAAGAVSHRELVRLVEKKCTFAKGHMPTPLPLVAPATARSIMQTDDNRQTHFCLGFPGVGYNTPDRITAMVASAYLGGGMSSVLFHRVREEKGLAYTVYTFTDFYRDGGLFGVYLGTDKTHLRKAFDIVMAECRKLKKKTMSSAELDKIKAQIRGQIILSMESSSNRMNRIARFELMMGRYLTYRESLREIERITPAKVREIANRLFDESRLAITVLGPVEKNLFSDFV